MSATDDIRYCTCRDNTACDCGAADVVWPVDDRGTGVPDAPRDVCCECDRIVAERDKAIAERDAARGRIERALGVLRDPNTHRAWKARDAALDILTEGQET